MIKTEDTIHQIYQQMAFIVSENNDSMQNQK